MFKSSNAGVQGGGLNPVWIQSVRDSDLEVQLVAVFCTVDTRIMYAFITDLRAKKAVHFSRGKTGQFPSVSKFSKRLICIIVYSMDKLLLLQKLNFSPPLFPPTSVQHFMMYFRSVLLEEERRAHRPVLATLPLF